MTVEAAVAVCGLVVVLALGVGAVMAVVGQVRCTDAVREVARVVARGDEGLARGVVDAVAPGGASFEVRWERAGEGVREGAGGGAGVWVEVWVSRFGVELRARAYAVVEPGVRAGGR